MVAFDWKETVDGDKFYMADSPNCWVLIKDGIIIEKSAWIIELETEKDFDPSIMLEAYKVLKAEQVKKGSEINMNVLYVDAWREPEGGWSWNSWCKVGTISKSEFESLNTNRKKLKWFRDNGHTAKTSAGYCIIEDDGYNMTVCTRSSRPLFAIEYGPIYIKENGYGILVNGNACEE